MASVLSLRAKIQPSYTSDMTVHWRLFIFCPHPIHVKRVEDLVHISISILRHSLQPEDGLQLKQRDQARWRLPHELVVPVVHVLSQDVVQGGVIVAHV